MSIFPAVDPIPLPAPVWLFKALHALTTALHFITVEMLLGGVAAALVLSLAARRNEPDNVSKKAADALASRLPVLTTSVINFGVPPLLFAQVLYGRALYTSSVLIGLYWIAVLFLLVGCYWHLYAFAGRREKGRAGWPAALVALVLAVLISRIYSTNMTLMIQPDTWKGLYETSAIGAHLPSLPTLNARWAFMLAGGLAAGGLWMIWLAGKRNIDEKTRAFLSATGGKVALVMLAVQVYAAYQVVQAQPAAVQSGLGTNVWYHSAGLGWLACAGLLLVVSLWAGFAKPVTPLAGWLVLVLALVGMLSMALYRDGIRDLTLAGAGYDVWDRQVNANWSVVGLFLGLFVLGLVAAGWLLWVVLSAKPSVKRNA